MRHLGRAIAVIAAVATAPAGAQVADLVSTTAFRVCADPGNLPMSSQDGTGFENRIAEVIAAELDRPVEYTWFPMATGFVRRTLRAGTCDVIIGYAQGEELVLNTNHYYTSVYLLVTRAGDGLSSVDTLSDPALQGHRIGVIAGTPPASHLARHGLAAMMKGYRLVVDRRAEDPSGDMLRDLAAGELDAAVLWGPVGGPLTKDRADLVATPLLKEQGAPRLFYRITMGVRAGEDDWKRQLNSLIRRNQDAIDSVLREAGVPLADDYGTMLKPAP